MSQAPAASVIGTITDRALADALGWDLKDVKKAWRQGRLRGIRHSGGLTFRVAAVEAFLAAEEDRWHEANTADRGSTESRDDPASTSTGGTETPNASEEEAQARAIANSLKKPSGSSSSSAPGKKSRVVPFNPQSATR